MPLYAVGGYKFRNREAPQVKLVCLPFRRYTVQRRTLTVTGAVVAARA